MMRKLLPESLSEQTSEEAIVTQRRGTCGSRFYYGPRFRKPERGLLPPEKDLKMLLDPCRSGMLM